MWLHRPSDTVIYPGIPRVYVFGQTTEHNDLVGNLIYADSRVSASIWHGGRMQLHPVRTIPLPHIAVIKLWIVMRIPSSKLIDRSIGIAKEQHPCGCQRRMQRMRSRPRHRGAIPKPGISQNGRSHPSPEEDHLLAYRIVSHPCDRASMRRLSNCDLGPGLPIKSPRIGEELVPIETTEKN